MRIDKLYLQNFRCYDELEFNFDKNLTVIVGENGKGKTAILDALAISLEPYLRAFGCKGRNMNERDVRRIKDAGNTFITSIFNATHITLIHIATFATKSTQIRF